MGVGSNEFERLKKTLAVRVKHFRKEKGLSQEDLADLAEIDRTYVSQIERGVIGNPSLLVISKVARALDVSVVTVLSKG